MPNVKITDLPAAQALDGQELVPIVQNGVTVRTTTQAISQSPNLTQTFLTVDQEPTLPNSQSLSAGIGVGLNDNGPQSTLQIVLNGASGSLEAISTGLVVKTASNTVAARSMAVSGAGLTISNGSGVGGNPTLALDGVVSSLANSGSSTGILALPGNGTVTRVTITGTANQIDLTNGDGSTGNPTIAMASNPVIPGTAAMTIPVGTTAQQPAGGGGQIRFNSDTQTFDGYASGSWRQFSLSGGVTSFSGGATGLTPSTPTSGAIVLAGTLNVGSGGTGVSTLTGYVKGNGTSPFTASATIPNTDISGLGTMSTQNADSVSITGGTASLSSAIISANSSTNALRITQVGSGNALLVEDSANPDATPFVVDAAGRVGIGGTAFSNYGLTVNDTNAASSICINTSDTASAGSVMALARARTTGTAVQSGDRVGIVNFLGNDGTSQIRAGSIFAEVDGTPGTNDMPGRLVFSTTLDGASTPTERMRINNAGQIGFNSTSLGGGSGQYRFSGNITGAVLATGIFYTPTIQSDVTTTSITFQSQPSTQDAAFSLASLIHFQANQGTITGGSRTAPTNQYGFFANSTLTGATNNYGFYGNISNSSVTAGSFVVGRAYKITSIGTTDFTLIGATSNTVGLQFTATDVGTGTGTANLVGRWNFYAAGTAENFFGGNTIISVNSGLDALRITQVGTGNALVVEDSANPDATPFVVDASGILVSGGTTAVNTESGAPARIQVLSNPALGVSSYSAVNFTNDTLGPGVYLGKSRSASVGTFGTVVQSGDGLGSLLFAGDDGTQLRRGASIAAAVDGTPGTNDMPGRLVFSTTLDGASTPTERMRIDNAGRVLIGSGTPNAATTLQLARGMTGGTSAYGVLNNSTVQSDVTTEAQSFRSSISTAASAFTLTNLRHFYATQGTIGSTSSITNQFGFTVDAALTGATNNYGFYGNISSGTGRWNFYAAGTADNYFAGNVLIGTTSNASSYALNVNGTVGATSFSGAGTGITGTASGLSIGGNAGTATNISGGTAGALTYNTGSSTTTFLALGTTNYVLTAGATAPQYVAQSTLSVGSATTATTATNIAGGAAGSIAYNSGAGATTFLALGTANQVLTAGATAPQYVAQSTLSVGSATTATNIAGGTAGALAYNTGAGATTFLALGTTNYVLTAGATAPQYVAQSTLSVGSATSATNATNTAVTANSTNATNYLVFKSATTGNLPDLVNASITCNPSTGKITAGVAGGTF